MSRHLVTKAERLPTFLVWLCAGLVTTFFLCFVGDIAWRGIPSLSWDFLTETPQNAGRQGGIGSILVSTTFIIGVCMVVAFPIGLGTSIFLAEFTTRDRLFGRIVRRSLDVLAGVPSIVFGLFGYAFFCQTLGLGFSILSGGLTLACMILPLLIRTTEEGLRAVPLDYRLSAGALGLSRSTTLWHLLLPASAPALLVGFILGLGRAIAETAALIFTSGYMDRMPSSLFDSGRALSIHIYDLTMNVPGGDQHAYGTAVVLVGILVCLNILSRWITESWIQRKLVLA